jgi:hypothetical protein
MAESTRLVAVHRELLIVQHQLTEQLDLLDLIVRRRGQSLDRLRLDAVDLGLDLRNFLQRLRREHCAALVRARRVCTQRGGEYGRCDRQKCALCFHFGSSASRC